MIKVEYDEGKLIDLQKGLMHYREESLKSHARWTLLELVQKHLVCDYSHFTERAPLVSYRLHRGQNH